MPSLARVFRVLRVTRLFKLAGSLKGLQAIIQTIIFSIGQLSNVVLLLFIILFMFNVLAVELFGHIKTGEVINEYKNFSNFHKSMLLLLAIMTGESWNVVMFDCSRTPEQGCVEGQNCGSILALFYFNIVIIVCSYVMLQLFILVIIQQFDKYYLTQDNSIKSFKDDLEKFYRVWKIFTQKRYRCLKIKENQLQMFFRELGGDSVDDDNSLGFHADIPNHELKKNILKMGIKSNNGYIYFNELLYRCMRKKFGNMKLSRQMQIFELRTQYNIFLITQDVQNRIMNKQSGQNAESIYNDLIQKSGGFNPFVTEMNYKITFKTWLKYARDRIRMERQGYDYKRKSVFSKRRGHFQKLIDVEIEIQKEIEYTSEEEFDLVSSQRVSGSKNKMSQKFEKFNKSKTIFGQLSKENSVDNPGGIHQCANVRDDHLVMFEKHLLNQFKSLKTFKQQQNSRDQSQFMTPGANSKTPGKITESQQSNTEGQIPGRLLHQHSMQSNFKHQIRATLAKNLTKKLHNHSHGHGHNHNHSHHKKKGSDVSSQSGIELQGKIGKRQKTLNNLAQIVAEKAQSAEKK